MSSFVIKAIDDSGNRYDVICTPKFKTTKFIDVPNSSIQAGATYKLADGTRINRREQDPIYRFEIVDTGVLLKDA